MNAKKLLEAALSLSPDERADLAHDLLDSLEGPHDEGVESAWIDEIEKRLRELDNGSVIPVDWKDARKRITERLHGKGV